MKFTYSHAKYRIIRSIVSILMLAILVLATIDTNMFIYPSLSRTLISEILVLSLSAITLIYCIVKKVSFICTKLDLFILAWITYITIHYGCSYPHEQYRTIYLAVTLLTIPTVSLFLRHGYISRKRCEDFLLIVAIIHIVFIIGQWTGTIDSGNKYFMLTGSNENPTVTALYIIGCLPIIAVRLKNKDNRIFYTLFLFANIITIAILHCRTAYIGLSVEIFIGIIYWLKNRKTILLRSYKYPIIFFVSIILACASMTLYNMKHGSADGRWLIWKISSKMIINHPQGFGYGLFEKYYNIHQAEYFEQNNGTETEKYYSDNVFMPYSDYLEHGVEGGLIGLAFLVVFYGIFIKKALDRHDIISTSIVSSFAVMSFTNFVYSSIQPWFLLMIIGSFIASNDKSVANYNNSLTIILGFITLGCISKVFLMTKSQIILADCKEKIIHGECVSEKELMSLQPYIGTSEAYWTLSAYYMLLENKYVLAVKSINKALDFTSSPQTLELAYYTYLQSGMENKGIKFIHMQSNMMPMRLRPKLLLMEYYNRCGDINKALSYANEIESTPHKIESKESDDIRNKAHRFIKHNYKIK